jgi:hypothetical protein
MQQRWHPALQPFAIKDTVKGTVKKKNEAAIVTAASNGNGRFVCCRESEAPGDRISTY